MKNTKILILEGIATSGKTSVKNELERILNSRELSYSFIDESETLLSLLKNSDAGIAVSYISELVNKYLSLEKDILIFDRLYLTHLWRTGKDIENFQEVTDLLVAHNTSICFLKIPEENIAERIQLAQSHRDEEWNNYVKSKGDTHEEIVKYYSEQQNELLELLKIIPIEHKIFETGDLNFVDIAQEIDLML